MEFMVCCMASHSVSSHNQIQSSKQLRQLHNEFISMYIIILLLWGCVLRVKSRVTKYLLYMHACEVSLEAVCGTSQGGPIWLNPELKLF